MTSKQSSSQQASSSSTQVSSASTQALPSSAQDSVPAVESSVEFPLPDALFSTKAGTTPQLYWGLPLGLRPSRPISREAVPPVRLPWDCFDLLATVRKYARENTDVAETAASLVQDAAAISVEQQPLAFLLMCAELPLTLAYLCTEKYGSLRAEAEQSVRQFLEAWFDDNGMPHFNVLNELRLFLASFVRMRLMVDRMGTLPEDLVTFFNNVVHQALCLTRPDGSQVFSSTAGTSGSPSTAGFHHAVAENALTEAGNKTVESPWNPELFVAALQQDTDANDKKTGLAFLPGFRSSKGKTAARPNGQNGESLPDGCGISDWSRIAVMRHDWNGSSVTVKWDATPDVELEISRGRTVLFSGSWTFAMSSKRKNQRAAGEPELLLHQLPLSEGESYWHVSSWTEDEDVAMLTLEASHPMYMVRRQILLAKKDDFVLLMDSAAPYCQQEPGSKLTCQTRLALNPSLQWTQNEDSREIRAIRPNAKAASATVLPLTLPEWQTPAKPGNRFQIARDALVCTCTIPGDGAFIPLFCDLSPKRSGKALTWRRLSIGEKREPVPSCAASGFRVQIAESQWLIYRSLTPPVSRTVLGHHLNDEFLVARFTEEGTVEDLVRI